MPAPRPPTNSDGEATPDGLAGHYARAGFDVLAITDPWHVTDHAHDEAPGNPVERALRRALTKMPEADIARAGVPLLPEVKDDFPTIDAAAAWIRGQRRRRRALRALTGARPGVRPVRLRAGAERNRGYNGGSQLTNGNASSVHFGTRCCTATRPAWASPAGTALPGVRQPPGVDDGASARAVGGRGAGRAARRVVLRLVRPGRAHLTVSDTGSRCAARPPRAVTLRSGPLGRRPRQCGTRPDALAGPGHGQTDDGLITACTLRFPELWRWGRVEVQAADGTTAWTNPMPLPLDTTAARSPTCDRRRPPAGADLRLQRHALGRRVDHVPRLRRAFADHGRPLSQQQYLDELAGLWTSRS